MRFELDRRFLRETGLAMDSDDLRLGLLRGYISASTAVQLAIDSVGRGSEDRVLLSVAGSDQNDPASVREALLEGDHGRESHFPLSSMRKWAYLELKAAYEVRDRLSDPLGVVEEIYADFDYPESVASFVRYMPPPAGSPTGEDALYSRWASYLVREKFELARRRD